MIPKQSQQFKSQEKQVPSEDLRLLDVEKFLLRVTGNRQASTPSHAPTSSHVPKNILDTVNSESRFPKPKVSFLGTKGYSGDKLKANSQWKQFIRYQFGKKKE